MAGEPDLEAQFFSELEGARLEQDFLRDAANAARVDSGPQVAAPGPSSWDTLAPDNFIPPEPVDNLVDAPEVMNQKKRDNELLRETMAALKAQPGEGEAATVLRLSKTLGLEGSTIRKDLAKWGELGAKYNFDPDAFKKAEPGAARFILHHPELAPVIKEMVDQGPVLNALYGAWDWVQDAVREGHLRDKADRLRMSPEDRLRYPMPIPGMEAQVLATPDDTPELKAARELERAQRDAPKEREVVDSPEARAIREGRDPLGNVGPVSGGMGRAWAAAAREIELPAALAVPRKRLDEQLNTLQHSKRVFDLANAEMGAPSWVTGGTADDIRQEIQDNKLKDAPSALGDNTGAMRSVGIIIEGGASTLEVMKSGAVAGGAAGTVAAVAGGAAGLALGKTPAASAAMAKGAFSLVAGPVAKTAMAIDTFRLEFAEQYQGNREAKTEGGKHFTIPEAYGLSTVGALINTGLELFSLGKQMKVVKGGTGVLMQALQGAARRDPAFRTMLGKFALEVAGEHTTEGLTEAFQTWMPKIVTYLGASAVDQKLQEKNKSSLGIGDEGGREGLEAFQGGFMGPFPMTLAGAVTRGAGLAIAGRQQTQNQEAGKVLWQLASDPNVQAAPAEFAEHVEEVSKAAGTPLSAQYLDPTKAVVWFQENGGFDANREQVDKLLGAGATDRIITDAAQGSRTVIPLQAFFSGFATSEFGKKMQAHLSSSETGATAEEYQAEIESLVEEYNARAAEEEQLAGNIDRIRSQFLEAGAPRAMADKAAKFFEQFYATRASEFKTSLEEMANTYQVQIWKGINAPKEASTYTDESLDTVIEPEGEFTAATGDLTPPVLIKRALSLSYEQKSGERYIDPISNLRNLDGFEISGKPEGKLVAVITPTDLKPINDSKLGGHVKADEYLRLLGDKVREADPTHAARHNTNLLFYVDSQEQLNELVAKWQAELPQGLELRGSVGATSKAAMDANDKFVSKERADLKLPFDRKATNFNLEQLKEANLFGDQARPQPEAQHSDEMLSDVEGRLEDAHAYVNDTYYDRKMPGTLNALGFEHVGEREFVVALDGTGIKAANTRYGKEMGDRLLALIAEVAQDLGGRSVFFARLHADEYACKSNNREELLQFVADLKAALAEAGFRVETPLAGGAIVVETLTPAVRWGIARKTYEQADIDLARRKGLEGDSTTFDAERFAERRESDLSLPRPGDSAQRAERALARRMRPTDEGAPGEGEAGGSEQEAAGLDVGDGGVDTSFDPAALATPDESQLTAIAAAREATKGIRLPKRRAAVAAFLDFLEGKGPAPLGELALPRDLELQFAADFGLVDPRGFTANARDYRKLKRKTTGISRRSAYGQELARDLRTALYKNVHGRINPQAWMIRAGLETMKVKAANLRAIGIAFEKRQREKFGKIAVDDYTQPAIEKMAEQMAADVDWALEHDKENSGLGWYTTKMARAMKLLEKTRPEIKKKEPRALLVSIMAVTSNGQDVLTNMRMAIKLFDGFNKTGKFNLDLVRAGIQTKSIQKGLLRIAHVHEKTKGEMADLLLKKASVSEMKHWLRALELPEAGDYLAEEVLPFSTQALGPKVGAFYANMQGEPDYLTMDRWWMRSIGRYRGWLIDQPTKEGIARLREMLGMEKAPMHDFMAEVFALQDAYDAKDFKNGTEAEVAANTIAKAMVGLLDSPKNGSDRHFQMAVARHAQELLAKKGHKLELSDVQAVMWYFEKRLYEQLGSNQEGFDIAFDTAAETILAEEKKAARPAAHHQLDENPELRDQVEPVLQDLLLERGIRRVYRPPVGKQRSGRWEWLAAADPLREGQSERIVRVRDTNEGTPHEQNADGARYEAVAVDSEGNTQLLDSSDSEQDMINWVARWKSDKVRPESSTLSSSAPFVPTSVEFDGDFVLLHRGPPMNNQARIVGRNIRFTSNTHGEHELAAYSDAERVQAHWEGFRQNVTSNDTLRVPILDAWEAFAPDMDPKLRADVQEYLREVRAIKEFQQWQEGVIEQQMPGGVQVGDQVRYNGRRLAEADRWLRVVSVDRQENFTGEIEDVVAEARASVDTLRHRTADGTMRWSLDDALEAFDREMAAAEDNGDVPMGDQANALDNLAERVRAIRAESTGGAERLNELVRGLNGLIQATLEDGGANLTLENGDTLNAEETQEYLFRRGNRRGPVLRKPQHAGKTNFQLDENPPLRDRIEPVLKDMLLERGMEWPFGMKGETFHYQPVEVEFHGDQVLMATGPREDFSTGATYFPLLEVLERVIPNMSPELLADALEYIRQVTEVQEYDEWSKGNPWLYDPEPDAGTVIAPGDEVKLHGSSRWRRVASSSGSTIYLEGQPRGVDANQVMRLRSVYRSITAQNIRVGDNRISEGFQDVEEALAAGVQNVVVKVEPGINRGRGAVMVTYRDPITGYEWSHPEAANTRILVTRPVDSPPILLNPPTSSSSNTLFQEDQSTEPDANKPAPGQSVEERAKEVAQVRDLSLHRERLWFSTVEHALVNVAQLGRMKMTGPEWVAAIKKADRAGGAYAKLGKKGLAVKQEELDNLGLEEWLGSIKGNVHVDRVLEFVRAHRIELTENERSDAGPSDERRVAIREGASKAVNAAVAELELSEAVRKGEQKRETGREGPAAIVRTVHRYLTGAQAFLGRDQYHDALGRIANARSLLVDIEEAEQELLAGIDAKGLQRTLTVAMNDINQALRDQGEMQPLYGDWTRAGKRRFAEEGDGPGSKGSKYVELSFHTPYEGKISSHYDEQATPNYMAHARLTILTKPDGSKELHVEEIQSDLHQKAREWADPEKKQRRGYVPSRFLYSSINRDVEKWLATGDNAYDVRSPDKGTTWYAVRRGEWSTKGFDSREEAIAWARSLHRYWASTVAEMSEPELKRRGAVDLAERYEQARQYPSNAMPDVAWKDSWEELVVKRLLKYAADNGATTISWGTGLEQNERYGPGELTDEEHAKRGEGMRQAYEVRLPAVVERLTGSKPVFLDSDPANEKMMAALDARDTFGAKLEADLTDELEKRAKAKPSRPPVRIGERLTAREIRGESLRSKAMDYAAQIIDAIEQGNPAKDTMAMFFANGANPNAPWVLEQRAQQFEALAKAFNEAEAAANEPSTWKAELSPAYLSRVKEEGQPLFATDPTGIGRPPLGYMIPPAPDALRRIFDGFFNENANASTYLHEPAHAFLSITGELARRSDAPIRTQRLWADILLFVGSTDGNITQEQHEFFAEHFTRWVENGNAPSHALARAFAQFRLWLRQVLYAFKGQKLPPGADSIFSRLLATDREIERYRGKHGPELTGEDMGLTPEEFDDIKSARAEDTIFSTRRAELHAMQERLREQQAWWKEALVEHTAAAGEEYDDFPAAKAVARFAPDLEAGREQVLLNRAQVELLVGKEAAKRIATSPTGHLIDDAAAWTEDFKTGPDLVRALVELPDRDEWVNARALELLKEKEGDALKDPKELRKLVADGMAGVVERRILEEMAALRSRGPKDAPRAPRADSLKRAARVTVDGMPVRGLSASRMLAAERKAAGEKVIAAAGGKHVDAFQATLRELMARYQGREVELALEDRDALEALASELSKDKARARLGKAIPVYRDAIDYLLGQLGVGPEPVDVDATIIGKVVNQMNGDAAIIGDPQWLEDLQGLLNAEPEYVTGRNARMAPLELDRLTVKGMRVLFDVLTSIRAAARARTRVLDGAKLVDREAAKTALLSSLANSKRSPPGPVVPKASRTWMEDAGRKVAATDAFLRNPSDLIRELTGDDQNDPLWRMLVLPLRNAKHEEARLLKESVAPIIKAFENMPRAVVKSLRDSIDGAKLFPGHVEGLVPPRYRFELLMMLLHSGNEGNLQRLLDGRKITREQLEEALKTLTKEELAWAQTVWDAAESLREPAFALEERVTGLRPQAVAAVSLTINGVSLRGGYFPAVYEPDTGQVSEKQAAQNLNDLTDRSLTRPSTPHGSLKKRADKVSAPLSLDPNIIFKHFARVTHDVAFREALMSVGGLILDKDIDKALRERLGPDYTRNILRWLQDVAQQETPGEGDWLFQEIRRRMGSAVLGWKPAIALGDFANWPAALAGTKLKARYLAKAIVRFNRNPFDQAAWAKKESRELRGMSDSTRRQYGLHMRDVTKGRTPLVTWYVDHGFAMVEAVQQYTATPVWMGSYEQARADGLEHDAAVRFADDILTQVWPSDSSVEKAGIMRDRGVWGLSTIFYGYLSMAYRNQMRILSQVRTVEFDQAPILGMEGKLWRGIKTSANLFAFYFAYQVLGEFLMGRGPEAGDEDDEEKDNELLRYRNWMLRKIAVAPINTLPMEAGSMTESWLLDKRANARGSIPITFATTLAEGVAAVAESGRAGYEAAVNDGELEDIVTMKRVDKLARAIALYKGIPAGVLPQAEYLWTAGTKEEAPSPLDFLSGMLHGERKGQPSNIAKPFKPERN